VYQKAYFLYVFAGCLPKLVGFIPLLLYDLVGEKRESMYLALNERRALIAAAQTEITQKEYIFKEELPV